jgi:hypothetical protein
MYSISSEGILTLVLRRGEASLLEERELCGWWEDYENLRLRSRHCGEDEFGFGRREGRLRFE